MRRPAPAAPVRTNGVGAQQPQGVPNPMMPPSHNQDQANINMGQRSRSFSKGPQRRATNSSESTGKSYSEIREAYNIPSNNTLAAGVFSRSESGDLRNERQDRRNNDGNTVNTGMSTRRMGNNNSGNIQEMRPLKNFSELVVPMEGYASDVSTNNNGRNQRHGFQQPQPPAGRPPAGRTMTMPISSSDGGYASDHGGKRTQRHPPHHPHQQPPAPGQRRMSTERIIVNGSSPSGVGNNGYRRRRSLDGFPHPQTSTHPTGGSGSHNGSHNTKLCRVVAQNQLAGKRGNGGGSPSDAGSDGSDFNRSDRGLNNNNRSRNGLKPLPENTSFRGSNPHFDIEGGYPPKNLKSVSVEGLKAELKQHGIAVDGRGYEKKDLINICAQQRKKNAPPMDLEGEGEAGAAMARANAYPYQHAMEGDNLGNDLNSRQPNEVSLDRPNTRSRSLDRASAPPAPGERGGNNNNKKNRRRRRQTIDRDSTGHFSDNPQQGMPSFVSNNSNKNNASKNPSSNGSRQDYNRRNSSKSSISSMGDPDFANEMAVFNAPLGVGLSGVNQDIQNPNQQMGLLLHQMQQLEERMTHNAPQAQAQLLAQEQQHSQERQQQRNSASGTSFLSVKSSGTRRISTESGHSNGRFGDMSSPPPNAGSGHDGSHGDGGFGGRRLSARSGHRGHYATPNASLQSGPPSLRNGPPSSCPSQVGASWKGLNSSLNTSGTKPRSGLNTSGTKPRSTAAAGSTRAMLSEIARNEAQGIGKSAANKKKSFFTKKNICIAVFLILIAGGALAGALILFVFNDGGENENDKASSSRGSVQLPQTASPAPSPMQYLEEPPLDIEGLCSPSNLPGSLSACLAACLPSACCYPDSTEESCVDDTDIRSIDACNQYRPYCDVFYDPWPGAEEGVLRSPPESIVALCMGNAEESKAEVSDAESEVGERPNESVERKRHRHHVISGELRGGHRIQQRISTSNQLFLHDSDSPRRNMWIPTPDEICDQHCRSARCCHAPSNVSGTVLSASGVYTDSVNGEHVVTSCQQEFGKNNDLCWEYDKFCDIHLNSTDKDADNAAWTSRPTAAPSASIKPSSSPSATPTDDVFLKPSSSPSASPTYNVFLMTFPQLTASPTVSSSPTQTTKPSSIPSTSSHPTTSNSSSYNAATPLPTIVQASTLEIAAACSGTENEAMISGGEASSRANCISACQTGLCCYADMLGYGSWLKPCFKGNEGACLEYLPCIVLVKEKVPDSAVAGNSTTTYNNITEIIEGPPIPAHNLTLLCSQDSIFTLAGLVECASACEAGSCCNAQEAGESSCYSEHPGTCALYQPCMNLVVVPQEENTTATTEENPELSPPAEDAPRTVEEPNLPPPASTNLMTMCSYESLASIATAGAECFELCKPAKCCSDGSCLEEDGNLSQAIFDSLDDICEAYQPCYNLNLLFVAPSNLDEICDGNDNSTADECAILCSAVSCCFSGSTSSNDYTNSTNISSSSCYAHFEETCNGYAPYCAPVPPTPEPSTAPFISLPSPPTDLAALCASSSDICNEVCKVASCCFESSLELSCFADNKERCEEYSPCSA